MGLNIDLCQLFGLSEKIRCPRCNVEVLSGFDDYDIECGSPNPSPGVWSLACSCTECEHEWRYEFALLESPPDEAARKRTETEVMENALDEAWQLLYPGKTDWEYPGQVVAHLEVAMKELRDLHAADGHDSPRGLVSRAYHEQVVEELRARVKKAEADMEPDGSATWSAEIRLTEEGQTMSTGHQPSGPRPGKPPEGWTPNPGGTGVVSPEVAQQLAEEMKKAVELPCPIRLASEEEEARHKRVEDLRRRLDEVQAEASKGRTSPCTEEELAVFEEAQRLYPDAFRSSAKVRPSMPPGAYVVHPKDHPPCLFEDEAEALAALEERGDGHELTYYYMTKRPGDGKETPREHPQCPGTLSPLDRVLNSMVDAAESATVSDHGDAPPLKTTERARYLDTAERLSVIAARLMRAMKAGR